MNIAFALFYLVYTFVLNWLYDVIFPIEEKATGDVSEAGEREAAR
ncbi:putative membrane protein [Nitratireductor basaltis]|uniref:Putative membrane protein n=2 Tax=Nitratireductor basaltis TaxID=472175 RepID=A0A084UER0_9HYPH|nr:putative membrane protein [Nitratireductor basaltis]